MSRVEVTTEDYERVLTVLKTLRDYIIKYREGLDVSFFDLDTGVGICMNFYGYAKRLYDAGDELDDILHDWVGKSLLRDWPGFSGCAGYPVSSPDNIGDKFLAEQAYHYTEEYYEGEYGKLRLEYIEYLIKQWEEKVQVEVLND